MLRNKADQDIVSLRAFTDHRCSPRHVISKNFKWTVKWKERYLCAHLPALHLNSIINISSVSLYIYMHTHIHFSELREKLQTLGHVTPKYFYLISFEQSVVHGHILQDTAE